MQANKKQKQLIHVNAPTKDIKEELVQWATGDVEKTSCSDLSFEQANEVLKKLNVRPIVPVKEDTPLYWGFFTNTNEKHQYILSLLRQIGWVKGHQKYGRVADIERFGAWLQSEKSPVKKPLKKMTPSETSKVITALESMLGKKFSK